MKKWISAITVAGILILSFSLSGCYYDSEEYLYGNLSSNCPDSSVYTFGGGVQPILQKYCYTCHSNSSSSMGGGIKLQNYADVKVQVSNGKLIGTISHANGFLPMPQGSSKIPDCNILIIQKWIDNNAPND